MHFMIPKLTPATALAFSLTMLPTAAVVAADEPRIDEKAVQLADRAQKHIAGARTLSTEVKHTMKMTAGFMRHESESTYDFAFERPNRMVMKLTKGMMGETVVSDGEKLYTHLPQFNRYIEEDAPASTDELLDAILGGGAGMGQGPLTLLFPLVRIDYSKAAADGTLSVAEHKGMEEQDGLKLHRIAIVVTPVLPEAIRAELADQLGEEFSMQLMFDAWVEDGDAPLVRRIEFDMSAMMAKMLEHADEATREMLRDVKQEMIISLDNWKVNDDLPAQRFAFSPPEGAEKVASMMDIFQAEMGPHPLLGQKAPDFELQTLDGSTMSLAQHRGKDIVVLDFWATWCRPCIAGMPGMIEVTDEYRDRGVVLYAVNTMERDADPADHVRGFIEEKGWKLRVPLDRDGTVTERYQVSGIPHVVVIDRDGTIQAVHIGSPQKERFRQELDTLLAGRSLLKDERDKNSDE
jgi:peroxiredoxin/outer membrane lipoprotein-sorting protein